jgi:hypothetical protein
LNLSLLAALQRLPVAVFDTGTGGFKPAGAGLLMRGIPPQMLFALTCLAGLQLQVARTQVALQNVRTGNGHGAQAVEQALAVQAQFFADLRIKQLRVGVGAQARCLLLMVQRLLRLAGGITAQALRAMFHPVRDPARVSGRRHATPPRQRPH